MSNESTVLPSLLIYMFLTVPNWLGPFAAIKALNAVLIAGIV